MISVIVPIYNVEPYLRQCLDSILAQTYNDIEIILVDDGSTDGCPAICDEYQEKDDRIEVFHTENRGLSAARNLGIDNAHGEWLMFVDSDDWVEPGFCEMPYRAALKNDADLVIFGRTIHKADISDDEDKNKLSGIISVETAVAQGRPAVWNKLYHKVLFDNIRYPVGKICEDVATTYKVVYQAKKIMALDTPLYNYRIRKDGITGRKTSYLYRELYKAQIEQYKDLQSYGFSKEKLERIFLIHSLFYLIHMEPEDEPLYRHAAETVSAWQGSTDGFETREKNAIKLWRINEDLFHSYYRNKECKAIKPE